MVKAVVITPVKNAIETTLDTAKAISESDIKVKHIIFNDFSSEDTREKLEANRAIFGYELIHLEDFVSKPSPNYDYVLQKGQSIALDEKLPMIIVESDVVVKKDTFSRLLDFLALNEKSGMIGAITVDEVGMTNFPYLKFKNEKKNVIQTERSLSFCCTLISLPLLKQFDLNRLERSKDWFDTTISKMSINLGFRNFVLNDVQVWHRPHGSRPWKQLKYTNPIKYYWQKFILGRDKI
ncbi:glycosyltransferase family 2 protein [Belliella sp. R4-6]|uniref:Glycosyltransferase family 2 protein n=1 Tax=Belliella alkalica TaxID=1730871 RepID=A0ABS9V912_9BACT|nr:glycosyltransferase family A protein [Belliella alkalica]MCH7412907.1 glycosyltransferase family 2 protein [Belliella alkalica]